MKKLLFISFFGLFFEMMAVLGQPITNAFYNANIITMDPDNPLVSAIAISQEKVVAVGTDAAILAQIGDEIQAVDLEGKTVLPGFICAHNHLFNDAGTDEASILASQQLMFENGITTFGNMYSDDAVIEQLRAMDNRGLIKIKSNIYLPAVNNCGDLLGEWYLNYKPTRIPGEKVRFAGVKVFTDGGTCGTLPAISWPYAHTRTQGDLFFDQSTLNNLIKTLDTQGYQIAIHAQGDLATRQSVEALSRSMMAGNPKRHRIEHNSFIPTDLLPQYGQFGIIPVVWGYYPTCDINPLANAFGFDSLHWLEDWRSLIDANPGLPIAWHSDAPILPLSPILNLYSYVTKQMIASDGQRCEPPDWLFEHSISVDEALGFITSGPAYALDRDLEVGSLKAGKYADLVFLSDDPHSIEPNNLHQIEILATMANGEFVYCREESQWICEDPSVATKDSESLYSTISLESHPNPFSNETKISFHLAKSGMTKISIYNTVGQMVGDIIDQKMPAGQHEIIWNPAHRQRPIGPGIYFLELNESTGQRISKRIIILAD